MKGNFFKKIIFFVIVLSSILIFTSCSCSEKISIYYLNFKTEQDQAWQKIAKKYEEEKAATEKK